MARTVQIKLKMTETVSDRLLYSRELKKTLNFHKTVGKTFSYLSLFCFNGQRVNLGVNLILTISRYVRSLKINSTNISKNE